MIRRALKHRRNRRRLDPSNVPTGVDANVDSVGVSTSGILVTFDQPVQLDGIPSITYDGAPVTAASQPAADQILMIKAGATAGDDMVVVARDPAIRTKSGGYAQAGTFPGA